MTDTSVITYLFDPLCGWCYGASPVLERLAAEPGFTLDLVPTGLFAGDGARPMDAPFASYAWANDQRIAGLTGQRFSEDYRLKVLGDHTRLFDSRPATLALAAVRLTKPEQDFTALKAIQGGRYVQGRDNTDMSVLAEVLRGLGLDGAATRIANPDADLMTAYRARLDAARTEMRRFGLEGVPALIVGERHARRLIRSSALFGNFGVLLSELKAA